ncbi:MAG TPA: ATP-binding cassette domain-containing protein, partial [Candidatus Hydrogenedentes bacterium]|nr:ATP-binding cassette domain-containing protein [Candidatus Hydrogenedentota bacterium]
MVTLSNVTRRLGPGVVFQCLAFHAEPGARVALWGPSGCGKSTLLNLISGLLRPHAGAIVVDGVDIAKLSEAQLDGFRGERFGFIFQTFNLL